ncbi:MAG: flagellar basal-body MS-ring/collar protein FliF [Hyphomonadaceae bacterium]
MNNLVRLLLQSGPARIIAALGATALVASLIFGVVFNMGAEQKALLFSGVDMKEAGAITAKLEQASIPYELRGDGSTIFVPRSKVLSARMMLSADGLPSRGSVGYEIFDKPDALGSSQFVQNINRLRALEGELARSIASLDGVESARVHLVIPERQLFERDKLEPTASIVLKLNREQLAPGEVRAVRNLVASATPGLSPAKVTILDETGRLLAAAQQGEEALGSDGVDTRQTAMEDRIRRTVQDIVEGVVGPGAARVQVTADLDLNRVTQNSETYDPEGRVVRSTQTVEETSQEKNGGVKDGASVANNVPGGAGSSSGTGEDANASSRSEEIVNYEISKTTKSETLESGRIRKLSVAVAVDGVTTPAADGKGDPTWTARSADDIARITALVRSAVGYDEARGDKVEVVAVRFARAAVVGAESKKPGLLDFASGDIMRGAEIGAALIAALALIIFVLRPLIGGLVKPTAVALLEAPAGAEGAAMQMQTQAQLQMAAPAGAAPQVVIGAAAAGAAVPMANALPGPSAPEPEPLIDVARIRGQVRASSTKKIGEVVESHPEESASIIRGWLNNAI